MIFIISAGITSNSNRVNLICYLYKMIMIYVLEYDCGIDYNEYCFDQNFYNNRYYHSLIAAPATQRPNTMKVNGIDTKIIIWKRTWTKKFAMAWLLFCFCRIFCGWSRR